MGGAMKTDQLVRQLLELEEPLADAEERVLFSSRTAINAKEAYADAAAAARLARNEEGFPLITGKNAEERDAQLRQMTAGSRAAMINGEKALDEAQSQLRRLRDELSILRTVAMLIAGR